MAPTAQNCNENILTYNYRIDNGGVPEYQKEENINILEKFIKKFNKIDRNLKNSFLENNNKIYSNIELFNNYKLIDNNNKINNNIKKILKHNNYDPTKIICL